MLPIISTEVPQLWHLFSFCVAKVRLGWYNNKKFFIRRGPES